MDAIVAFAGEYRVEALERNLAGQEFAALLDAAPPPPPIDWTCCAVVEWMAGPLHDTRVLVGTSKPADMAMKRHDDGWRSQDIAGHYGWDGALVAALIAFGGEERAGTGDVAETAARQPSPGCRKRVATAEAMTSKTAEAASAVRKPPAGSTAMSAP